MEHYFYETLFLMTLFSFQCISVDESHCQLHESKEISRCCIPITVHEGYQPVICDADGEWASFEPCPANTHQSAELSSSEFQLCERHSTCPLPNMITLRNGNSTSNTVCRCNEAGGYLPMSKMTVPTEPYHCSKMETVSQPSSVRDVTSVYPAAAFPNGLELTVNSTIGQEKESGAGPEEGRAILCQMLCVSIVITVLLVSVVSVCTVVICYKRKCISIHFATHFSKLANYICNRRWSRNNELSAGVPSTADGLHSVNIGFNSRQHNDRNHVADIDLRISSNQPSYLQAEDNVDPDLMEPISLHSEHNDSDSDNSASLCCQRDKP